MIDFGSTIINSIFGGAIMALAASLNLYLLGKITGISGIIFKCLTLTDCYYNFSFLLGMIFISSFLRCFIYPNMKQTTVDSPTFLESSGQFVGDLSLPGFIIAGFLVGFGAKMANGCTSGHGVCGLPRLSKRSIVAIALFILFGLTTATLKYYLQFLRPSSYAFNVWEFNLLYYLVFIFTLSGFGFIIFKSLKSGIKDKVRDVAISFIIGSLFGFGLIQSGMLQRHVVIEFLTIGKVWNIQLAFVLGTAVSINLFTFNFILKKVARPKYLEKFDLPTNNVVDNKLCVGAAIFGVGWGLSGICPGPAILTCYLYCPQILAYFIFLCAGMYIESYIDGKISEPINKNPLLTKFNKFQKLNENK